MSDVVVVGAGLYGLTVAERLADAGRKVTLLDRRPHVGGNAFSYFDENGIEIHKYGAHLFHTSNERVWEYVNRFTSFTSYVHHVYALHLGEVFPLPINLGTINQFYRRAFTPTVARAIIQTQREEAGVTDPQDLEEKAISLIGTDLYNAFIKNYTAKQWQVDPKSLPPDIISRLPVRYTYDNRYFSDTHEGLPVDGYAAWLSKMADHKNIDVQLGVDFFSVSHMVVGQVPVVYTGPLDRYFNNQEGALSWRTVDFDLVTHDTQDLLGTSVINYSDLDTQYTRAIEFKHFHPERESFKADKTVVAYESSRFATDEDDEPYYPVNSVHDRKKLETYRELAREETEANNVHFGGRLGNYRYWDMHMAIAAALSLADNKLLSP
jgi:UDP-galactopyranose mutase